MLRRGLCLLWLVACVGGSKDDPADTDGVVDEEGDADGDGYTLEEGDCDDSDNTRAPGVSERCNGIDDNCDALVDNQPFDGTPFFTDSDGDGFGDPMNMVVACAAGLGVADNDLDCDDSDGAVSPAAWEACNGVDDDCDRLVDDADINEADRRIELGEPLTEPLIAGATRVHPDFDGDGWPRLSGSIWGCAWDVGYIEPASSEGPWDCNDENEAIHPGAPEVTVGGGDRDCDGEAPCFADVDGDGHGDAGAVVRSVDPTCGMSGVSLDGFDCDDTNAAIHHELPEVCDGSTDEDCDGQIDDADASVVGQGEWYFDHDGDGHFAEGPPHLACVRPARGQPDPGDDCLDTRVDIHPGAPELCDGDDNDCNGQTDEATAAAPLCYLDLDGDGYGDDGTAFPDCDCGRVFQGTEQGGDCQPGFPRVHPGANDICNGFDDDCSGVADDDPRLSLLLYVDSDGDGFGDPAQPVWRCATGPGLVDNDEDCREGDAATWPGAPQVTCDRVDNDCDPATLEASEVYVDGVAAGPLATAVVTAGAVVELCEGRHAVAELALPEGVQLVGLVERSQVVVDAGQGGAALLVGGSLTLSGLTLRGGAGHDVSGETRGGAVWVDDAASLVTRDVHFIGSRAGRGGAVWLGQGAAWEAEDVLIEGNRGDPFGAVVDFGGAVVADEGATLSWRRVRVVDNEATGCGALQLLGDNVLSGEASVIEDNRTLGLGGGGVCAHGAEISGVDLLSNRSQNAAGGIEGTDLVLRDLAIRGNRSDLNGGGIYASGQIELTNVVITDNIAGIDGGGLYVFFDSTNLTLTGCEVSSNVAEFFASEGGGVALSEAHLASIDTDWGIRGADNRPHDVVLLRSLSTFDRSGVSTFSCDDSTGVCQ